MTKNDRGKESGIHDSNKGNYDLNGSNGDLPSNVKEISFAEITLAKNDIVKEVIEKTKPFEYYDISANEYEYTKAYLIIDTYEIYIG